MQGDRVAERAARAAEDGRTRAVTVNTISVCVLIALVLVITAAGFRSGSVAWMAAAVAQFILVGAWSGLATSEAGWARGRTLSVLGMEVHLVGFRVMVDLYLALLLALPFTTVFDGLLADGW